MYVNTEKKVAFIAHPRTASQATAKTLVDKLGFKLRMSHHVYGESPSSWTVFATVRNPFDLLVSWYYLEISKTKHDELFETWLRKCVANPNEYIQRGLFFALYQCTDVLHFENLQEEFDQLMEKLDLPPTKILLKNVSEKREGRDFNTYYNPELTKLVMDRFGRTVRELDYSIPRRS